MSYELLDRIADAYVPALGLVWLIACLVDFRRKGWRAGGARLLLGLLGLALVYGVAWLDARGALWARFGLDYSTHTAVAAAMIAAAATAASRLRWPLGLSFAAYGVLMLYQRYHTLGDIVSTLTILAVPLCGLALLLHAPIARGRNAAARADGSDMPDAGPTMSAS
jgi:hypothetical protein